MELSTRSKEEMISQKIIIPSGKLISEGNVEYLAKIIAHKNKIPMSKKSNIKSYSAG